MCPSSELRDSQGASILQPFPEASPPLDAVPSGDSAPDLPLRCTEQGSREAIVGSSPWAPTLRPNEPARTSSPCLGEPPVLGDRKLPAPAAEGLEAHASEGPVASQSHDTSQASIQLVVDVCSQDSDTSWGSDMTPLAPEGCWGTRGAAAPKEELSGSRSSAAWETSGVPSGGGKGCEGDAGMEELEAKLTLIGLQRQLSAVHCATFLQTLESDLEQRRRRQARKQRSMHWRAFPSHTSHSDRIAPHDHTTGAELQGRSADILPSFPSHSSHWESGLLPQNRTVPARGWEGEGSIAPRARTERSKKRSSMRMRSNSHVL